MINEECFVASFGSRLISSVMDFLIIFIPLGVVLVIINGNFSFNKLEEYLFNIVFIIYLIITPLYWNGKTVGKNFEKIQIQRVDNEPIKLFHLFLREFVGKYILATITFGITTIISAFMIHFRNDKRAIHDLIAGTYVTEFY